LIHTCTSSTHSAYLHYHRTYLPFTPFTHHTHHALKFCTPACLMHILHTCHYYFPHIHTVLHHTSPLHSDSAFCIHILHSYPWTTSVYTYHGLPHGYARTPPRATRALARTPLHCTRTHTRTTHLCTRTHTTWVQFLHTVWHTHFTHLAAHTHFAHCPVTHTHTTPLPHACLFTTHTHHLPTHTPSLPHTPTPCTSTHLGSFALPPHTFILPSKAPHAPRLLPYAFLHNKTRMDDGKTATYLH